jgi:hypothetical protein
MCPLMLLLACTDSPVAETGIADSATAETEPAATHLVVTTVDGIEQRTLQGALEHVWRWEDLSEDCASGCKPEGIQPEGDGLIAVYSSSTKSGGVLRLQPSDGDLVVQWEFRNYSFPHDAITDPSGLGVIVAETFAGQILWLDPDDESVLATLGVSHPDWEYSLPNSLDLLQQDDRYYLLMSNRGNDLSAGAGSAIDGTLVLWDISDPRSPIRTWVYPETGTLGMPHSPVMRRAGGTWTLAYAHSIGLAQTGDGGLSTVGLAQTDDLTKRPTYLVDALLPDLLGDIKFSRGVELSAEGRLYVVETGAKGADARLLTASLPELSPSGLSGAYDENHTHQSFHSLEDAEVLAEDVAGAFEVRLWTPTYQTYEMR